MYVGVYACVHGWVFGCVGVYNETPDRNDLKLGTVRHYCANLQPNDFGFKRSSVGVRIRVGDSAPNAPPESAIPSSC